MDGSGERSQLLGQPRPPLLRLGQVFLGDLPASGGPTEPEDFLMKRLAIIIPKSDG